MTITYGIAQIIAPAITGVIAENTGSYSYGLYLAAAMMVVGTVFILILRSLESKPAN